MSFEGEKNYFKQPGCKLTEKYSKLTLNAESGCHKESNMEEKNSKDNGERQHKLNATSNFPRISQDFQGKNNPILEQSLGWRDPGYQYERNTSPKKNFQNIGVYSKSERVRYSNFDEFKDRNSLIWRKESTELSKENRNLRRRSSGTVHNDTVLNEDKYNGGNLASGYWGLECFPDDKYADMEDVWATINQIYHENPELFDSSPVKTENSINCYIHDFNDVTRIRNVSNIIRQKLNYYPLVFYYYIKGARKYMSTCDGDIYRSCLKWGWKVIDI